MQERINKLPEIARCISILLRA